MDCAGSGHLAELARLTSCSAAQIYRFVELGLVGPFKPDRPHEPGDVTRVRLVAALERSGIDLTELSAAVRERRLSLRFAGDVLADPVTPAAGRRAEIFSELGIDPDLATRIELAIGLPTTTLDDPLREDDQELFAIVQEARRAGLDESEILRALRVFGISLRQIVEVQREFFREAVEEPLLAKGMSYQEMLDTTTALRMRLQRLGFRAVFLILRRFLEQVVFENLIDRIEALLAKEDISPQDERRFRTIVFIDLSGSTDLIHAVGDESAAVNGTRLIEIAAARAAQSDGRLVKTLGDGVMLSFRSASVGVQTTLKIVERVAAEGLPSARAGIATGPVIHRDGDCYGAVVNLAARLVDVAEPGTVLVTQSVVGRAGQGFHFTDRGLISLQGFDEPLPVFSVSKGTNAWFEPKELLEVAAPS